MFAHNCDSDTATVTFVMIHLFPVNRFVESFTVECCQWNVVSGMLSIKCSQENFGGSAFVAVCEHKQTTSRMIK